MLHDIGIPTVPLALAPTPAKPAKITLAVHRTAAYKAKQYKSAKAYAIAEGLQYSKRTTGSNAGRNTTNSSLTANKDNNNAYNRAYIPPTDIKEKEGSSSNNNSVNSSTSNSANKGKGSSVYKRGKGALYYKDTLLRK
ncbi:hypothetical protein P8C59_003128 [Phyllachora maydis]|uniref:Uncharacterized protein n=1 Tax=Phyllachora maydis TaxID=1825666 RepID=A0AAD9HZN0_9PEZI|nr:hypothetical protein P8C59_003128 [Phyllachora maydis]